MPEKRDDLIVDLLQEVRKDQKEHSEILVDLKHNVAVNTKDLTDHKEGVVQNRKRIEKLEEPSKMFAVAKKYLLGAGAIAGAILVIIKFSNAL